MKNDIFPIHVRQLKPDEIENFIDLVKLFSLVFEHEDFKLPTKAHLQRLLNRNDFIVFVAAINEEIIGGLTAYTLQQYYSEKPLAYIYDVAVKEEHQRKGIGKELIAALSRLCKVEGFEEMFVQAEKEDTDALGFYRSTSIDREQEVIQFSYRME